MDYKYIYDEQGEKEAVIIPIKEWEKLKKAIKGQEDTKIPKKTGLAGMVGVGKGNFKSVQEVDDYIDKLRNEWG